VRWIETGELAAWLAGAPGARPWLLDAREAAEFALSHLPGARRVDPAARAFSEEVAAGRPVVVYCSLGYRSAVICARLQQAGVADVRNLAGGVFQWANEGRELRAADGAAGRVHPYGALWGVWLCQRRHPARR
jgi:rhodanese-related sulfurtransferase